MADQKTDIERIQDRVQSALADPALRPAALADVRELVARGALNDHLFDDEGDGLDLLSAAAAADWADAVQELIAAAVDIHAGEERALREAAAYGNVAIVERLLAAGADVHAQGDGALRWACAEGQLPVVKVLIAAGATIDADTNEQEFPPLIEASAREHWDVVAYLIVAGADVHIRNDAALSIAAEECGSLRVVELLLAAGADVHADDDNALIEACQAERHAVTECLLAAGANANVNGGEALTLALRCAVTRVRPGERFAATTGVAALLRHGADASAALRNLSAKHRPAAVALLETLATEIPCHQRHALLHALLQASPRHDQSVAHGQVRHTETPRSRHGR